MHSLKYAEFYITNVCNLNCTNCNRFNNYAFSGHQLWSDHQDTYRAWAKKIDLKKMAILGGEPFTNPSFMDWVSGVAELWPRAKFSIVTNGTYLSRWPELYHVLLKEKNRMFLEVTMHGQTLKKEILAGINAFLKAPIKKIYSTETFPVTDWQHTWNRIKDPAWPDCPTIEDLANLPEHIQKECYEFHELGHYLLLDANGVRVVVSNQAEFMTSAVKINDCDQLSLHQSDPVKAIDICISKYCHHFSHGKLYKCGVAGILPDFLAQFPVHVSDEDSALIHKYDPAQIKWNDDRLAVFLKNLISGDPIDQCKFCPENPVTKEFDSSTKKPKIIKIKNLAT